MCQAYQLVPADVLLLPYVVYVMSVFLFSEYLSHHATQITTSTVMVAQVSPPSHLSRYIRIGTRPRNIAMIITLILLFWKKMNNSKPFLSAFTISGQIYTEMDLVSSKTLNVNGMISMAFVFCLSTNNYVICVL